MGEKVPLIVGRDAGIADWGTTSSTCKDASGDKSSRADRLSEGVVVK